MIKKSAAGNRGGEKDKLLLNGTDSSKYRYTYDEDGNIIKITDLLDETKEIRYVYDNIGQLIREDNTLLNATYVYTYDDAGNRLKKYTYALTAEDVEPTGTPASDSYIYSISNWMDRLIFFNETQITYDAIGNPLSYYNDSSYTFTWNGRRLTGAVKGSYVLSFTYNDEGIRTSKTVNGVTTT